jgi:hypothetical protein
MALVGDLCPADPNKISPGFCGCGGSDIDSDSDGIPDCDDGCPDDALKLEPSLCDCGFADGPYKWNALLSGINGKVLASTVFDDGTGPALYVGGSFTSAGGVPAKNIAKWNGTTWSALGSGVSGTVSALAASEDASPLGRALYVGGSFGQAGGTPAKGIAKWRSGTWTPLGSGVSGGDVTALAIFDHGSGPALYAGGEFKKAGLVLANRIAKWNGLSWSALGSGISGARVRTLAAVNKGSPGGPALYVGGTFLSAGGVQVKNIARWNGATWSALGTGTNGQVEALATFDEGTGLALFAGGSFTNAGGVSASAIAKWNGAWSGVGAGFSGGTILALVRGDELGGTPILYAGGSFTKSGSTALHNLASWNGSSWSGAGIGTSAPVLTLSAYDDGPASGLSLYAGGSFTSAGAVPAANIARWARECLPH